MITLYGRINWKDKIGFFTVGITVNLVFSPMKWDLESNLCISFSSFNLLLRTVQSVVFLNSLFEHEGVKGPFLIVAPLSTIPHWERTVKQWTAMNCVVLHGNASSRAILQNYEFEYPEVKRAPKNSLGK